MTDRWETHTLSLPLIVILFVLFPQLPFRCFCLIFKLLLFIMLCQYNISVLSSCHSYFVWIITIVRVAIHCQNEKRFVHEKCENETANMISVIICNEHDGKLPHFRIFTMNVYMFIKVKFTRDQRGKHGKHHNISITFLLPPRHPSAFPFLAGISVCHSLCLAKTGGGRVCVE